MPATNSRRRHGTRTQPFIGSGVLFALTLLATAQLALGQAAPASQPHVRQTPNVRIALSAKPATIAPDQSFQLVVAFKMLDPKLHAYGHDMPDPTLGTPTRVTASGPAGFTFAPPVYPASVPFELAGEKLTKYPGDFTVTIPVTAAAVIVHAADAPSVAFSVKVDYQACTDEFCVESSGPKDPPLTVSVAVTGGTVGTPDTQPAAPAVSPAPGEPAADSFIDRAGGNWLVALLFSLIVGLAMNLTPCVLPIIPLTVGFFVYQAQQSGGRSGRRTILASGLSFAAGMLATFLVLGGLVVFTGQQLQVVFQHPAALLGLGLFIVVMALGMFDVYPVQLPMFLAKLAGGRSGLGGALLMGVLAAVMSTPCTGPMLAGMIGWAVRVPAALGLAAFAGVGLGMALPYLVLTAAPGLLQRVPRSGKWTELVRAAMGFILLAVAAQMFTGLRSQPDRWQFAVWASLALAGAVWVCAKIVRSASGGRWVAPVRVALLAAVIAGIALRWPAEHAATGVAWRDYTPALLDNAKAAGQPVVLDMISDNCTLCEIMDRKVWPTDAAVRAFDGMLPVRVNMSRTDGAALGKKLNVIGPPTIIFLDGRGEVVRTLGFEGNAEKFAKSVSPIRRQLGLKPMN